MFPLFMLAAFIGVPIIEIALFIEVGGAIGTIPTVLIVILTAILGTWLLRQQGISTARTAQQKLSRGEMPVDQAFDGMFLVFAGALLLTPGFLTDAIGLSLFVPQVRAFLRGRIAKWAKSRMTVYTVDPQGGVHRQGPGQEPGDPSEPPRGPASPPRPGSEPLIDTDAEDAEEVTPRGDSPWRGSR